MPRLIAVRDDRRQDSEYVPSRDESYSSRRRCETRILIGMIDELKRRVPSAVTGDLSAEEMDFSSDEIRERMSGNLCRRGAYNGIVEAVRNTFAAEVAR